MTERKMLRYKKVSVNDLKVGDLVVLAQRDHGIQAVNLYEIVDADFPFDESVTGAELGTRRAIEFKTIFAGKHASTDRFRIGVDRAATHNVVIHGEPGLFDDDWKEIEDPR